MRKLLVLKLIFSSIVAALFLIILSPQQSFASHTLFEDDFQSGTSNQWVVKNGNWSVQSIDGSEKYGTTVNTSFTVVETTAGSIDWSNYILELDFVAKQGADKNIIFRVIDAQTRYGLHMTSSVISLEKWLPSQVSEVIKPASFVNNVSYHLKIVLDNQNIKVYSNDVLLVDHNDTSNPITHGKIGLKVGTGAVFPSQIWFDNIIVTGIDNILPVYYLSQNDDPWGDDEYDHASSAGLNNPTIERWGCAMTSAAMVLSYHGMTKFADDTDIDPGTLNNWLKNNNGYISGNGSSGPYAFLSWPAIGKLSKELFDAGKSTTKLEHSRTYPSTETTQLLNDDLTIRKIPDILKVQNASTSGHFVVAKGLTNSIYDINDPEWDVPTLTSFGDDYSQVDRFLPTNTNLSYLIIVSNPDVEILVTDPVGKKTGKQIVDGNTVVFNEINNATYGFDAPINNSSESFGSGVNVFLLPKPLEGDYQVKSSSIGNTSYTLNIVTYEEDGDDVVKKSEATVGPNTQDTFLIDYSQITPPITEQVITFQSTIDDVNEAQSLGFISKDSIVKRLTNMISNTAQQSQKGNMQQALQKLTQFEDLLNKERGKTITEEAYQILLEDVSYLESHL